MVVVDRGNVPKKHQKAYFFHLGSTAVQLIQRRAISCDGHGALSDQIYKDCDIPTPRVTGRWWFGALKYCFVNLYLYNAFDPQFEWIPSNTKCVGAGLFSHHLNYTVHICTYNWKTSCFPLTLRWYWTRWLGHFGIPGFQVAQRVRYRWGMMGRSAAWQSRAPIVANSDPLGLQLSNLGTADPKIFAGLWTEMTSVGDPQVWRPLLVSAAFRTTFVAVAKMNT